jgi:hypothetical protein
MLYTGVNKEALEAVAASRQESGGGGQAMGVRLVRYAPAGALHTVNMRLASPCRGTRRSNRRDSSQLRCAQLMNRANASGNGPEPVSRA